MFTVIFEVHPAGGRHDAYLALAAELRPILEAVDGFLDNERFASRSHPGWLLSLSSWRDEKAVVRWRTVARHHLIQGAGRSGIFQDYHLRVAEVTSDDHPPAGMTLRQQRFDTTEVGASPALTLTELRWAAGHGPDDDPFGAVALDRAGPGLVEADAFDSITTPRKILLRLAWARAEDAAGFSPAASPRIGSMRHRTVRVIRDYGMFDRREAPQYHPAITR